jgi:FKBP-type peptidyl-prolyl cis-trans isomerase FkpA
MNNRSILISIGGLFAFLAIAWIANLVVPSVPPSPTPTPAVSTDDAQTAYLAARAAEDGMQRTASGLLYRVITEGSGPRPTVSDTVEVHYRGTLIDGTEFDSSYSRNQTSTFGLTQVIAGWIEGLQLMPVGSTYEFVIPAGLAYGAAGRPGIPPNATLVFQVELIAIR